MPGDDERLPSPSYFIFVQERLLIALMHFAAAHVMLTIRATFNSHAGTRK
jgi:hypothetical protein